MDHGSDEGKNASLLAFKEGLNFPYRDYFNQSFFADHDSLLKQEVIEITKDDNKYTYLVNSIHK